MDFDRQIQQMPIDHDINFDKLAKESPIIHGYMSLYRANKSVSWEKTLELMVLHLVGENHALSTSLTKAYHNATPSIIGKE